MDYLKIAIPSQLIAERGSNLVVINPGPANVRIGLHPQDIPSNVPHCIARYTTQVPKRNVQDQIASLLKIVFLDEELANNSFPRKGVVMAITIHGFKERYQLHVDKCVRGAFRYMKICTLFGIGC